MRKSWKNGDPFSKYSFGDRKSPQNFEAVARARIVAHDMGLGTSVVNGVCHNVWLEGKDGKFDLATQSLIRARMPEVSPERLSQEVMEIMFFCMS